MDVAHLGHVAVLMPCLGDSLALSAGRRMTDCCRSHPTSFLED